MQWLASWRGRVRLLVTGMAAVGTFRLRLAASCCSVRPLSSESPARLSNREKREMKAQLVSTPTHSFRVCLVGRPNVGKSTLFNRLVSPHSALGRLGNLEFTVIDTGGYEPTEDRSSPQFSVNSQMRTAVEESDVVLFVVDFRGGVTSSDVSLSKELKKLHPSNCVVVINKTEGLGLIDGVDQLYTTRFGGNLGDIYSLGFSSYLALSAEHGEGLLDLYDVFKPIALSDASLEVLPPSVIQIAILGRPNSGKSTLMNAILNEDRVITSSVAGTTRDAVQAPFRYKERDVVLVDTAGIRPAAKRKDDKLENLSVHSAWRSLSTSHVGVLLLDGLEQLSHSEQAIANNIADEGRGLVLALNKGDVIADTGVAKTQLLEYSRDHFPDLGKIPSLVISAKEKHGIDALLDACLRVYDDWNRRINTGLLNRWLRGLLRFNPPPSSKQHPLRIKYITQVSARPPTFALFSNRDEIPASYERFLKSKIREEFGFNGVPVRFLLRRGENPYE